MKKLYYLPILIFLLLDSPVCASLDRPVNLIEDATFRDFTLHLNPENSITNKREEAFSISEDGLLYVSRKGRGYLRTNSIYGDYRLVLEYKWGDQPKRGFRAGNGRVGGLLIHAFGEEALYGDTWPSSIVMKLHEPSETKRAVHTGDFIVLANLDDEGNRAPTQVAFKYEPDTDGGRYFSTDGRIEIFPEEGESGARLNGIRDKGYVERQAGEWNRVEVVCRGDSIRVILNGNLVNECTQVAPLEGFVGLQIDGSEMWIRKWELWPLDRFEQDGSGNPDKPDPRP